MKGLDLLERLVEEAGVVIESVTPAQAKMAGEAKHYGILNFGDSFSYVLAKDLGAPLLFKCEDFSRTNLMLSPLV